MKLIDSVITGLREMGIPAQRAKPWNIPGPAEENTALAAVSRVKAVQGAIYRYLGMDENDREMYGMALTAEIKLSLLSPKKQGGEAGETFAGTVTAALMEGINGMPLKELRWEETRYDALRDCFVTELYLEVNMIARGVKEEEIIRLERFELRPNYE